MIDKRIIKHLTEPEKEKLLNIISGYGNCTQAAEQSGLNYRTIRLISISGRGLKENIEILRKTILKP